MADSYDAGFWDAYAQLGGGYNANSGMDAVAARAAAGAREWEKAAKAWRAEAERLSVKARMTQEKFNSVTEGLHTRISGIRREVQRRTGMTDAEWMEIRSITMAEANNKCYAMLREYGWDVDQSDLGSPNAR